MKYNFNVERITQQLIDWVKNWFIHNGPGCKAIIGISGGKDSTIAAKVMVEALGKENVIGVMLPIGNQHDLDVAKEVCEYLDIQNYLWDIDDIYSTFIYGSPCDLTDQAKINLAPRIRMTALRFIAQCLGGRLINTSNLSEDWVGYATIDGDAAGDMSPFSLLTVQEVKAIGHFLKIPGKFVEKVPEDGLVGKSDEENLGVSYDDIDNYIRGIKEISENSKMIIDSKYNQNYFKLTATIGMPRFIPDLGDLYNSRLEDFDEAEKIPSVSDLWRRSRYL